jgi:hypothetical protein
MVTTKQPPASQAEQREIWQMPWNWPEAVMLLGGVIYIAFLLQFLANRRGMHLAMPVPWNWVVPIGLAVIALVAGLLWRRGPFVRWLGGLPFAVTAIVIYTVLGLVGILTTQVSGDDLLRALGHKELLASFGLRNLYSSIPFLVASMLIILNLAALLGRRIARPKPGFIGFLLNHLGLLIVMVAMIAGTAQRVTVKIPLFPGESTDKAVVTKFDHMSGQEKVVASYPLGGMLTLDRFNIDYYPPTAHLMIIDMQGMQKGTDDFHRVDEKAATPGHQFSAYGITVRVEAFLPSATPKDNGEWTASDSARGMPVLKVAYDAPDGHEHTQWLTEGMHNPLKIGDNYFVMMQTQAEPKRYQSFVTVKSGAGVTTKQTIEVNKPLRLGQWWLYQSSYGTDQFRGQYTVLEAWQDPAMMPIYLGMLCMVLGAFVSMWFTPRRRLARQEETTPEEDAQ